MLGAKVLCSSVFFKKVLFRFGFVWGMKPFRTRRGQVFLMRWWWWLMIDDKLQHLCSQRIHVVVFAFDMFTPVFRTWMMMCPNLCSDSQFPSGEIWGAVTQRSLALSTWFSKDTLTWDTSKHMKNIWNYMKPEIFITNSCQIYEKTVSVIITDTLIQIIQVRKFLQITKVPRILQPNSSIRVCFFSESVSQKRQVCANIRAWLVVVQVDWSLLCSFGLEFLEELPLTWRIWRKDLQMDTGRTVQV